MAKLDILFVTTPLLDLSYPPAAPAVLQAIVRTNGKTCNFFDTNLYLFNDICGRNGVQFEQISNKFITPVIDSIPENAANLDIVDLFFDHDDFHGKYFIRRWLDEVVGKIIEYDAEWIGISVFSYFSQRTSFLIAYELKKHNPNCKIVIGGKGSTVALFGPDNTAFTQRLSHLFTADQRDTIGSNFYDVMLGLKLCDLAVRGEGENSIMEIWSPKLNSELNSKPINFIRGKIEELQMEDVPFVDYDNYKLDEYRYITGNKILAITGSKGCVRACTFCDIGVIWPKFKHRGGKHIAAEMIHLYKKYNVKKFFLTDSLVNGSKSAFKDFVDSLSIAMKQEGITDLTWHGQYITRPIKQVDQEIYAAMANSGAEGLTIGVESGSDAVRDHMAKKFSSSDLDHEMEQFSKHGLDAVLLFFSSYPTETWKDFLDTMNMWIRYQRFAADRTMYKMTLGQPYTHHADTPLWLMQDEIELSVDPSSDILWLLKDNPELDFVERLVRRVISQEVAVALNLPLARNTPELIQLTATLISQRREIESYFDLTRKTVPLYVNQLNLPNLPDYIMTPPELQQILYKQLTETEIVIRLSAKSDTNWLPAATITLGDYIQQVTVPKQGADVTINITESIGSTKLLTINFTNQPVDDTYFYKINDTDIHSTKSIKVDVLKINGVDLTKRWNHFMAENARFIAESNVLPDANLHTQATEMYTNGTFTLALDFPILNHIISKNTQMGLDDIHNDNQALLDLKVELVKYNYIEQEKWLQILTNLN
jgi:radical SAM superfamily enzyme YgiQ (UPF0313 family)